MQPEAWTAATEAFVRQRHKQMLVSLGVSGLALVGLAVFFVLMYRRHPLFLDPFVLRETITAGHALPSEVATLAVLGNVAFVGCGLLGVALICVVFLSLLSEWRLLRIIHGLRQASESSTKPSETPVQGA